MSALPTLKQELDRKSFETCEWLFASLDNGKLTPAQFSAGIDALFMATAGLVDKDIVDIVSGATSLTEKGVFKRVFILSQCVVAIEREAGAASFTFIRYEHGVEISKAVKEYATSSEAMDAFNQFADNLARRRFTEI